MEYYYSVFASSVNTVNKGFLKLFIIDFLIKKTHYTIVRNERGSLSIYLFESIVISQFYRNILNLLFI